MKITEIEVNNYRLLKNFSIILEKDLSLIIGKNNTGKTSLLHILQNFLCTTSNVFNFEDFSIKFQKTIIEKIKSKEEIKEDNYENLKIELKIIIERKNDDNLSNISDLILDLDPNNKTLLLSFEYVLDFGNFNKLKNDYENHHLENLIEFLKKHHKAYFTIKRKVVDINDESNFIEIEDSKIQKIICVQTISAKRDVLNEDGDNQKNNKTLSKLSYKYFKPFENSQASDIIDLQKKLIETDTNLSISYQKIFEKVTEDLEKFSYNGSKILVKSNFQEINILRENTSVTYDEDGYHLPEDYSGLGYMNLFAMIFELHIIFDEFKKTHRESESADINLLFIEEPEAHTHPQMQYVFIKNIKQFLEKNKDNLNLQTVITTHSSHITSQSDFNDIKYFLNNNRQVEVKNLSDLKSEYGNSEEEKAKFKFLKQYLTLNRAELFFSDKIIFIEGDTERILLPAIMRKLDIENKETPNYIPLLSQKISIVEVGAHSKSFDKFLEFLEIKTLVITDLDSVKPNANGGSCRVSEGTNTSNISIKHFLTDDFQSLKNLPEKDKIISRNDTKIYITYQIEENSYHARSFEDSFISLNLQFIKNNKDNFNSLQNKGKLDGSSLDYFDIADFCIKKKTEFATDILFYSNEGFTNWKIPSYISQGLLWLMKN
ncbi:MAG: AAA family ATPase [Candidatus Pacebacteria bacterium]|nr:AAA family ATPase [Candidatus Paceibacterota bacterium]